MYIRCYFEVESEKITQIQPLKIDDKWAFNNFIMVLYDAWWPLFSKTEKKAIFQQRSMLNGGFCLVYCANGSQDLFEPSWSDSERKILTMYLVLVGPIQHSGVNRRVTVNVLHILISFECRVLYTVQPHLVITGVKSSSGWSKTFRK